MTLVANSRTNGQHPSRFNERGISHTGKPPTVLRSFVSTCCGIGVGRILRRIVASICGAIGTIDGIQEIIERSSLNLISGLVAITTMSVF